MLQMLTGTRKRGLAPRIVESTATANDEGVETTLRSGGKMTVGFRRATGS